MTSTATTGRVALVGAGPGDAELITLKGARLLQTAEVVIYDNLVSQGILDLISPTAERIFVGKMAGNHTMPQDDICQLLVDKALEGKFVVRLKGGDPFVFGRGGEEVEELVSAGVSFEVVPGITAALGAASSCHFPLTHRDHAQSCVFVTGHLQDGSVGLDWDMLARPRQTVVFYMGVTQLPAICEQLVAHGLPATTPAAVVRRGTTRGQKVVSSDLGHLAQAVQEAGIVPPALTIVGEVVGLQERLACLWHNLWGQRHSAQIFYQTLQHAGLRQYRPQELHLRAAPQEYRGKSFHVPITQHILLLLHVQPHKAQLWKLCRHRLKHALVATAGATPLRAQAHHPALGLGRAVNRRWGAGGSAHTQARVAVVFSMVRQRQCLAANLTAAMVAPPRPGAGYRDAGAYPAHDPRAHARRCCHLSSP